MGKRKKTKSFVRILFYSISLFIPSLFIYVFGMTEIRSLNKDMAQIEDELSSLQNILEQKIVEVQKLSSEERIVKIAEEKLGLVRENKPLDNLFVSKNKIRQIEKIVNSKYD